MKLGEMFIALGFDVDDQKLKDFKSSVREGMGDLLKFSAAGTAALFAVNKFIAGSVQSAVDLKNFTAQTGLAADELQRWQIGATMANTAASVEGVTASIVGLQKSLADITMGQGTVRPFALFGIDTRDKDAFDILEEVRSKYQEIVDRYGTVQTNSLIAEMGIDPSLLPALQMTADEFERLAQTRDFITPEAQGRLVEIANQLAIVSKEWKEFKDETSAEWSPGIITGLKSVSLIAKELKLNLGTVAEYATQSETAMTALAVAAGGLAIAAAPLVLMVAALGVAFNDLGRALNGQKPYTQIGAEVLADRAGDKFMELWRKMLTSANKAESGIDRPRQYPPSVENLFDDPAGLMPMPAAASNQSAVNFSNTWNIQTLGDPFAIASEVEGTLQRQRSQATAEQNRGPAY